MAEPTTINVALIIPATGDLVGTWGSAALNPDFVAIDGFLGGVQTVSAAGNSPITLTSPAGFTPVPSPGPTQSQNGVIRFSGALTGNVQITLPLPGHAIIENLTTGAFVLSFRAIGSGQVIATQQGSCRHVYNDGTNVRFVNLPDVGSFLDLYTTTVPAWINACTIPPYLYCNGGTFSAATYPYLNAFLGGNTLPDLRGIARFTFNDGTSRITSATSGINGDVLGSIGGDQNTQAHFHNASGTTGNDSPDHTHIAGTSYPGVQSGSPTLQGVASTPGVGNVVTTGASTRHQHSVNINTNAFGAGGSQNMPPATISGISLIRAA